MKPVLFTISGFTVSSFGFFLLLAFLVGSFLSWRIAKIYEQDEEQMLDLIFLTFIGGLIFSRLFYVLLNLNQFSSFAQILLINLHPGLNFWGAFLGGFLILRTFTKRRRENFWQIADFVTPGFFMALSIGSIGCLLGSCQAGLPSSLPFAVSQVGLIGKRFPLQLFEAIVFFGVFLNLWRKTLRFHFNGMVVSAGLIILGLSKFIFELFRDNGQQVWFGLSFGHLLSLVIVILGIRFFYQNGKKSFINDLKFLASLSRSRASQKAVFHSFSKSWYNLITNLQVVLGRYRRNLFKLINVKTNQPKF